MIHLGEGLIRVGTDLKALRLRWAVIGGMAVSFRSVARATKDLDVAIAVGSESEAEEVVLSLRIRGYQDQPHGAVFEQKDMNRLATVRLLVPGAVPSRIAVDLFFASSGVEEEIVAAADLRAILPGVYVPIATSGHLLALKVLAGREKDRADVHALLARASPREIQRARETLALIERRGFNRGKNLQVDFARLMESET
jgi:hypothetical protein